MPEDLWPSIFEKQKELIEKYKDIEKMGTLLEETEINLNTAFGQKWIKDFAWRVVEELTEAMESDLMSEEYAEEGAIALAKEAHLHYQEELIDAVHFLAELTIIAGFDYHVVPKIPYTEENEAEWFSVVYNLGLLANCLKNKPWKQSQMLTDYNKARAYIVEIWRSMIYVLFNAGLDYQGIYRLYFKKNSVNKFRQRSKY